MFEEKDIESIFKKAFIDFNKKHKIDCGLKIVNQDQFMSIAKLSKIIREDIKNDLPVLVGALVEHEEKEDNVILNVDNLNFISGGDKKFVKAVIMHEFYHILFKSKVKKDVLKEDLKSEERAKKAMEKEFPNLAKYLV